MERVARFAVPFVVLAVVAGCGPTPPVQTRIEALPERRPASFALDVLVQSPLPDGGGLPRALRPARYILEPAGTLRVALGAGATREVYPPRTRQLSPVQIDALWRSIRDSAILHPANPARVDDADALAGSTMRTTATLEIFGGERPVAVRVAMDRGGPTSIAVESLIDELAALAWQTDPWASERSARLAPKP
ncbi:MAG: hypothetical protein ACKVW3_01150 [Phycisphaerales bacterium]